MKQCKDYIRRWTWSWDQRHWSAVSGSAGRHLPSGPFGCCRWVLPPVWWRSSRLSSSLPCLLVRPANEIVTQLFRYDRYDSNDKQACFLQYWNKYNASSKSKNITPLLKYVGKLQASLLWYQWLTNTERKYLKSSPVLYFKANYRQSF